MLTKHKIIIGNSKKMYELDDNTIHLIVTSPPYYNMRDYGSLKQIGFGSSLDDYLKDMEAVFQECYRVLQPGRKFCLNISDQPIAGDFGVKWIPLGFLLLDILLKNGFELVDRIIWNKVPMKGFQYGSLPYPPSPLICDSMEYIFILRKRGKANYNYVSKDNKEASKLSSKEYKEYTKQIWTINRVRIKDNIEGHIAPFPIDLPFRCILLYSFVNDNVLDPFGGSGTTTEAAIKTSRNSILYEIVPEYLDIIKKKILLATNLLGEVEINYILRSKENDTVYYMAR
ncbi:MAG: site-specific DNA-methyltransferase [Deltaproteobacteria bacterium]|nr:site-specific DNA-methyltransferase [Deltaproteobacteria bacterium]